MKLLLCALAVVLLTGCLSSLHPHKLPPPKQVPTYSTNVALKYVPRPPAPPPMPGTSAQAFGFNYNLSQVQSDIRLLIVNRTNDVLLSWATNRPPFILEYSSDFTNWHALNYGTYCRFDSNSVWYCEHMVSRPKNMATEFYRLRR